MSAKKSTNLVKFGGKIRKQARKTSLKFWSEEDDCMGNSGRPQQLSGRPHNSDSSCYFKSLLKC